jgi:pimeloyl-ACP methyl ester carboxylesterase
MLSQSLPAAAADACGAEIARRARLSHHVIELGDGHKVGVSVGGRGVPLVFLHGLGLNHRAYHAMLGGLANLGFLVVAIDAAGHGATHDFRSGKPQIGDFVALTLRSLDVLGIHKAVFTGHSMGGRLVIEVAASAPERVLAAVLLDAAAGASWEKTLAAAARPAPQAVAAMLAMLCSTRHEMDGLTFARASRYARGLTDAVIGNLRRPLGPVRAALAMMQSPDSTEQLRMMRERGIPTLVLHGENDYMVPFASGRDIAEATGGSLYRLRGACHGWLIANPRHAAEALRHLITERLGDALRFAAQALGIPDSSESTTWERALVPPHALIHRLNGERRVEIGAQRRRHVRVPAGELQRAI